ncbi:heparinase II/III family protein [Vibrio vulnificus]
MLREMVLSDVVKIFHTVKYLRFKQVLYRFLTKINKPKVNTSSDLSLTTPAWRFDSPFAYSQSMFEDGSVLFLSKRVFSDSNTIWNDAAQDKLWLYNLHYFDDLNSFGFESRHSLHKLMMSRWIDENPPCIGNGWEPYPLSLRLVNWVKWLSKQGQVSHKFLASIVDQANALTQQLEFHILGNHLFANAKALTFVGCYLDSNEGKQFLDLGLKILDQEIEEQFLVDGAHFELSPMYHQILLWDLLDLINLGQVSRCPEVLQRLPNWVSVAKKALFWLQSMLHPDRDISFFNDSAHGIAANPKVIFEYANQLGIDFDVEFDLITTHELSGYSRIQMANYTVLFDHANVGPDYLPGHAHADTLSFELSIGKQRVFVNSGTSLYGVSAERLRQRQTAAHNTVSVTNLDSSQVWSGFRVAKRAYAKLHKTSREGQKVEIVASHDGYMKQRPKVTHTRSLDCTPERVIISDALSKAVPACFHLHIHPEVDVINLSEKEVSIMINGELLCVLASSKPIAIKDSTWHPEFGKTIANKKIEINFANGNLKTEITKIKRES